MIVTNTYRSFYGAGIVGNFGAIEYREHGPVLYDGRQSSLTLRKKSKPCEVLKQMSEHLEVIEIDDRDSKIESEAKIFCKNCKQFVKCYKKVVIRKFGSMQKDLYIEQGVGVYSLASDGSAYSRGSCTDGNHMHVVINGAKLYLHSIMLLMLCPDALSLYMADDSLVINHVRIPEPRKVLAETDIRYLELVPQRFNNLHSRFVSKWQLWGIPVSSLSVDELDADLQDACKGTCSVVEDGWWEKVVYGDDLIREKVIGICLDVYNKVVAPGF